VGLQQLPGTRWRDTASGRNVTLVATETLEGTAERFLVLMEVEGMTKPLWARDRDLGRRFIPLGESRLERLLGDDDYLED
jgi:hypothetical protein